MKTLVLGGSGATGRQLVNQLLVRGQMVRVIARSPAKLPEAWRQNQLVEIIKANISEISEEEMTSLLQDCTSLASCLGHNLSFKGIYGKPRKLVTDAMRLVGKVITKMGGELRTPFKLVLMNTAGHRNRDRHESISLAQRLVVGLVRLLLPPHADNEQAAEYLRTEIGQGNPYLEWVVVRPDSLVNSEMVTDYELHPSPTRSAIFNPGKTSRINVGAFMAQLIVNEDLWREWKGQMPVVYNQKVH